MKVCPACPATYDDEHHFCPVDGKALRSITPLPSDQLGTTLLGQFKLTGIAGRGMGGVVYKAWQRGMERDVAVKILHRQLVRDRSMVRRFNREAKAVARLSHPNIVNVFTTGVTDYDAPFLVMEYVDGERLDDVIADGALPPERAVGIARQMVSALADTHAEGIIHRDLKPANVFLVQHRRTPDFVKLLDFGIAKLVNTALTNGESRLTREGAVCGTPHYIAPEQASGHRVDHRADLYSVGVMLYQMVCGRLPFLGSGMAVLLAHVNKEIPRPSSFGAEVPNQLEAIIMRCLAKDAGERYQSAEALADALDGFLENQASQSEPEAVFGDAATVNARAPLQLERGLTHDTRELPIAIAAASLPEVEPRKRRWPTAMACLALIAIVGFGGARFGEGYLRAPLALDGATAALPVNHVAGTPAAPVANRDAEAPAARRAVVVSGGRYSLRVMFPRRLITGVHHEFSLDVWDAGGKPLITSEVIVTLSREGGGDTGLAAKPTDSSGRYRFHRLLKQAGEYTLSVYPPGADDAIQVFFEVDRPDQPPGT